jgi:Protein of unknown function (DUF3014)
LIIPKHAGRLTNTHLSGETNSPINPQQGMNKFLSVMIVVVVIAIAGAGGLYWWQLRTLGPSGKSVEAPAVTAPAPPASAATAPTESAIQFPIDAASAPDKAALPALADSDKYLADAIGAVLPRNDVLKFLQLDKFANRVVATVDNLARPHAAPMLWPVTPTPGRFTTTEAGAASTTISAANSQRYTPLVRFIESVDTTKAVAMYVSAYPLFQQAYEELGYPRRYFNDRLVAVIDHLLATPTAKDGLGVNLTEVKGPIAAARPWVRYEFSDATLESLSSGQKMILRAGPDNQARLKIKLQEIRRQITSAGMTKAGAAAKP